MKVIDLVSVVFGKRSRVVEKIKKIIGIWIFWWLDWWGQWFIIGMGIWGGTLWVGDVLLIVRIGSWGWGSSLFF